ncbi:hypothetical protein F2Q70_00039949 [Brassica cretica]|uniref:Uncharacterized protein n=1 Tax=Brassica cretica TaxID=69181 RepID=A0A8S9K8B1_BRACR|nr:hypothetical protein F2Q70_00039949 [Brassica cretica]KAF3498837.1 hypothetical protein DY000_02054694 [Brassica cretica]
MRELERLKTSTNHQPWPPIGAPMNLRREEPCKSRFDEDSVNAVSFGFVATAILISMFLLMAIFEKLIRTTTNPDSSSGRILSGIDSRVGFSGSAASKLGYQSPKANVFRSVIVFSPLNSLSFAYMTVYANGVSVLMPGGNIPTFIAHPVPVPHPSQHISKSQHQHSSSRDSSNSNSIQEC